MCGAATIPSSRVPRKILDTEGRVDRFMRKYGMGSANADADAPAPKKDAKKSDAKADS